MGWDIEIAHNEVNYTHNINPMIREAGIPNWPYEFLDNVGFAKNMIEPLTLTLDNFSKDPEKYRAMNPKNGWGDFDSLQITLTAILKLCKENKYSSVNYSY